MHHTRLRLFAVPTLFVYLFVSSGCDSFRNVKREIHSVDDFRTMDAQRAHKLARASPYLKVHMRGGNLYVLTHWQAENAGSLITGDGFLYGPNRTQIGAGNFSVGVDSVSLFETNEVTTSAIVGVLAVAAVLTIAISIYCATHTKDCFGSCPTFYVAGVDSLRPRAEGFSASIAPSLEASDIDDLRLSGRGGETVDIEMRNEAYETHFVRRVDMLAVPRAAGERVFADSERRLWTAGALIEPVAATGPEGDCLDLVKRGDHRERFSETDSTDLRASEFIELDFGRDAGGRAGIVIDCRQTLLTTFLLYQTFAYMGSDAGRWFADLERGKVSVGEGFLTDYLGCIDIQVDDGSGQFVDAGRMCEYGPIAIDTHVVPLDESLRHARKVRLVMTQGNWRIDRVALARLDRATTPVMIRPVRVQRAGEDDASALAALLDSTRVLTTLPGDSYTLRYVIPGGGDYDLFLDSQGYYLEWIRQNWLKEENPALLAEMFLAPDQAMKRLAPEFKRIESTMEENFWSSKYVQR
jgi:hypothetical protein